MKPPSPEQIYEKMKELNIPYDQEHVIAVYLDEKYKIMEIEVLFRGGYENCSFCVKTLFRHAMKREASYLYLCHNHPYHPADSMENNLKPSPEDDVMFRQAVSAGELMIIPVLCGMIFNEKDFNFFAFEIADEKEILKGGGE